MSGNTNAATAGDASSGSATDASLGSTFVAVVVNNNGAKNNASAKNSHANNNSHGNNSHANNNKERPTTKSSSSSCACATDVYSTTSNATENSKRSLKRHRDETFREIDGLLESRDDLDTKSESFMDYDEEEDDDDTSASMSLGGFSMGSLGRIPHNIKEASSPRGKRRKGGGPQRSQSIHRTLSHGLNMNADDVGNLKLLEVSSTLSEGKMILKNLSINSSYSAEFADLCRSSPSGMNNNLNHLANAASLDTSGGEEMMMVDNDEQNKTPKKRNTSSKKTKDIADMAPLVFRLDGVRGGNSNGNNSNNNDNNSSPDNGETINSDNNSSPTMFDLIGGAETPTTGMFMNNIMEHALTDDIRSLNGHLRGQSFTPLPMMMSENLVDIGGSGGLSGSTGGLSITPQLSWSTTTNGSPLEITPRCFGLLDSTKSSCKSGGSGISGHGNSHHPLGSPKSFWKETTMPLVERKDTTSDPDSGRQGGVKSILSILSPTMREMDTVIHDGSSNSEGNLRSTSPLPLYYEENSRGQENNAKSSSPSNSNADDHSSMLNDTIKTPLRRPPIPSGIVQSSPNVNDDNPMHVHSSPWGDSYHHRRGHNNGASFAHSPIPHHGHPHHHAAASPYRDGPPPPPPPPPHHGAGYHHPHHHPHHGMYPPHAPHPHHPPHPPPHYNPNDRVRNLRGNGPPRHQMPPQHHLPPPSYHHFSPLTNVASSRIGRYGSAHGHHHHHHLMPHHLDMAASSSSTSKRKCVPIKPPIPSKFQGDIEKYKDAQIPEFNNLVNFPGHMSNKPSPNVPEGMRCCVMCGQACPCSTGGKNKKCTNSSGNGNIHKSSDSQGSSSLAPLGDSTGSNNNKVGSSMSSSSVNTTSTVGTAAYGSNYANIPTQNKGLCTICDVNVWIVTSSGLEIKWCKGCKNFRPWAAFGDKGLATKCVRCRERQREKYALQKEEKEKVRGMAKARQQQQQQVRQAAVPTMGRV